MQLVELINPVCHSFIDTVLDVHQLWMNNDVEVVDLIDTVEIVVIDLAIVFGYCSR